MTGEICEVKVADDIFKIVEILPISYAVEMVELSLVQWCSKNSVFTFGREQKDRSSFQAFKNFYNLFHFLVSPDLKSQKPLSTPLT
jgi:hypothetical protein